MSGKRIGALREILAQAAARDEELEHALETLAADLMKELGAGDNPPVWAEIKATKEERQLNDHFVMQDGWLRGDLVIEVTAQMKVLVTLQMQTTKKKTHDVIVGRERSRSAAIDPPDEKERDAARKELFDHVFDYAEGRIRQSVDLPAE